MKTFLILLVLVASVATAQDVRKMKWGMTKEQVKQAEGQQEYETGKADNGHDLISFKTRIAGLDCLVACYFVTNKLYAIQYVFSEYHTTGDGYKEDYINVSTILDQKYGELPLEAVWTNETYKSDYEKWGLAIKLGHLTYDSFRENERTACEHVLKGSDTVMHYIFFGSRNKELINLSTKTAKVATDDF
jgi:hypothetical protein